MPLNSDVGRFVKKNFVGNSVSVYFDGGKQCIGVVGFDTSDTPVFAKGDISELYDTNNVAEIYAAKEAVSLACSFEWACSYDYIKVIGDSMLVIKFLNKAFEPRKNIFYEVC